MALKHVGKQVFESEIYGAVAEVFTERFDKRFARFGCTIDVATFEWWRRWRLCYVGRYGWSRGHRCRHWRLRRHQCVFDFRTANAAITISGRQFSPTVHAIVVHSLMFFTNVSIFAETCRNFFKKIRIFRTAKTTECFFRMNNVQTHSRNRIAYEHWCSGH